MVRASRLFAFLTLFSAVIFIYGSHLKNGFHFDDYHTIVQNPYIHDIRNLPRFFSDSDLSSVLPANRVYRPVLFASLALDHWLGHGTLPWFHISTLALFVLQILLIFVLARLIFDRISPATAPSNRWAAFLSAALFGLHPVMAETVNYIIQRSELQSTLGLVAALVLYIRFPGLRRYALYLVPLALGVLSKPPALVFPLLLFLYIHFIEGERGGVALRRSLPSIVAVIALGVLSAKMTPPAFNPGATSAFAYRITQPLVMSRYFTKFFIPTGLSADTEHVPLTSLSEDGGIQGLLFLAALVAAIVWTARRQQLRPIAYGLAWFFIALVPTSLMPLAEVENDHRMFFPFVGLAIAAGWGVALLVRRRAVPAAIFAPACALVLAGLAYGSWTRCEVWKTDESLWRDVAEKSPHNGRGLMNYGLALMARGDFPGASALFERAAVFLPSYYVLEINRGIVAGSMKNPVVAEQRFRRAVELAPAEAGPKYYYARWLNESGRYGEASPLLRASIGQNPSYLDSYYLLMRNSAADGDADGLRSAAQMTLARFPGDAQAQTWLAKSATLRPTAETWLNKSLAFYQAAKYAECIEAAHKALELRPGYAEAWNNIAAAYNAQGKWDDGVQAATTAVKLNPQNQLAKNNLAWALQNQAKFRRAP